MLKRIARDIRAAIFPRIRMHRLAVYFEDLKTHANPIRFKLITIHALDEDAIINQVDPEGKIDLHALGEFLRKKYVRMPIFEKSTHLLKNTIVIVRARRRADLRNEVDVRLIPIEVRDRREIREVDLHLQPEPAEPGDLCILAWIVLKRNIPRRSAF